MSTEMIMSEGSATLSKKYCKVHYIERYRF